MVKMASMVPEVLRATSVPMGTWVAMVVKGEMVLMLAESPRDLPKLWVAKVKMAPTVGADPSEQPVTMAPVQAKEITASLQLCPQIASTGRSPRRCRGS